MVVIPVRLYNIHFFFIDTATTEIYTLSLHDALPIPVVLHQQPCYCYCDRMGHNSLHSCFENTHGAQCSTCLKELYYSYQQSKKGKTASQIRAGIIKGDRKQIDLESAAAIN